MKSGKRVYACRSCSVKIEPYELCAYCKIAKKDAGKAWKGPAPFKLPKGLTTQQMLKMAKAIYEAHEPISRGRGPIIAWEESPNLNFTFFLAAVTAAVAIYKLSSQELKEDADLLRRSIEQTQPGYRFSPFAWSKHGRIHGDAR